jgi:hypothetical protein
MKKSEKVNLIAALGSIAGNEIGKYLEKHGINRIVTITGIGVGAGIAASRLLPEDKPFTAQDYIEQTAKQNEA